MAHAEETTSPHDALVGKAYWKAINAGISWLPLRRMIENESDWNPKQVGTIDKDDRGLVQINKRFHPEVTDEEAFDEDFALDWAINKFKKGEEYQWVSCNCYLYAMLKVGKLPKMADIVTNGPPRKGGLILLEYKGVRHMAYIIQVMPGGVYVSESNFKKCDIGERFISFEDPHITGFWYSPIQDT